MSQAQKDTHTADIGYYVYDIIALREFMKNYPVQEIEVQKLKEHVSEDHDYWLDKKGEHIGPFDLLQDWEAAQKNESWSEHVNAVKNADIDSFPLWICDMPDKIDSTKRIQIVVDGMHRLTKAFFEDRKTIKYQLVKYEDLPKSAIVKER